MGLLRQLRRLTTLAVLTAAGLLSGPAQAQQQGAGKGVIKIEPLPVITGYLGGGQIIGSMPGQQFNPSNPFNTTNPFSPYSQNINSFSPSYNQFNPYRPQSTLPLNPYRPNVANQQPQYIPLFNPYQSNLYPNQNTWNNPWTQQNPFNSMDPWANNPWNQTVPNQWGPLWNQQLNNQFPPNQWNNQLLQPNVPNWQFQNPLLPNQPVFMRGNGLR